MEVCNRYYNTQTPHGSHWYTAKPTQAKELFTEKERYELSNAPCNISTITLNIEDQKPSLISTTLKHKGHFPVRSINVSLHKELFLSPVGHWKIGFKQRPNVSTLLWTHDKSKRNPLTLMCLNKEERNTASTM